MGILSEDAVVPAHGILAACARSAAPTRQPRIQDYAIPRLPPFHPRPYIGYFSRHVHTGDVGQMNGADSGSAKTLSSEYVEAVQGARLHPDHHVVRRFHRGPNKTLDADLVKATVLAYYGGPHLRDGFGDLVHCRLRVPPHMCSCLFCTALNREVGPPGASLWARSEEL